MTEKYIQLYLPCKECLVSPICSDKKNFDQHKKKIKGELFDFMLGLKRWDHSQKTYHKGLIEAWIDMEWNLVSNCSNSDYYRPQESSAIKNTGPEYIHVLIELANTLQWMINSESWRTGEIQDFDKTELALKLKQAIGWI